MLSPQFFNILYSVMISDIFCSEGPVDCERNWAVGDPARLFGANLAALAEKKPTESRLD